MSGDVIYHLLAPGTWPTAGEYRPASLDTEGFVHFSFAAQVAGSANRHYADADELVAIEVDPRRLDARVAVEDSYGSGTAYPHVYGPIPASAAVAGHPLRRDDSGRWVFSRPDAAPGHASTAR
jgi:uncharacterized protein (DUF952 family)